MKWLVLSAWLCLFTGYLAEQAIVPDYHSGLRFQTTDDTPESHYNQSDPLSEFYILPGGNEHPVPAPVLREPLFKWKSSLSDAQLASFSPGINPPEFVQDIWRCPAVAFVLFPFHEFL